MPDRAVRHHPVPQRSVKVHQQHLGFVQALIRADDLRIRLAQILTEASGVEECPSCDTPRNDRSLARPVAAHAGDRGFVDEDRIGGVAHELGDGCVERRERPAPRAGQRREKGKAPAPATQREAAGIVDQQRDVGMPPQGGHAVVDEADDRPDAIVDRPSTQRVGLVQEGPIRWNPCVGEEANRDHVRRVLREEPNDLTHVERPVDQRAEVETAHVQGDPRPAAPRGQKNPQLVQQAVAEPEDVDGRPRRRVQQRLVQRPEGLRHASPQPAVARYGLDDGLLVRGQDLLEKGDSLGRSRVEWRVSQALVEVHIPISRLSGAEVADQELEQRRHEPRHQRLVLFSGHADHPISFEAVGLELIARPGGDDGPSSTRDVQSHAPTITRGQRCRCVAPGAGRLGGCRVGGFNSTVALASGGTCRLGHHGRDGRIQARNSSNGSSTQA